MRASSDLEAARQHDAVDAPPGREVPEAQRPELAGDPLGPALELRPDVAADGERDVEVRPAVRRARRVARGPRGGSGALGAAGAGAQAGLRGPAA
jgi:hypothetical protein